MMNSRIFLCHSSEDKVRVRDLYQKLKLVGFEPWFDEKDILPGKEWDNEIKQAIYDSACVIVCLSKNSISKRGYVQKEISFALDVVEEIPEGEVFIIPARLEECDVPKRLLKWQWVDLFDPNGFQKLISTLSFIKKSLQKQNKKIDTLSPVRKIENYILTEKAEEYLTRVFSYFVWKGIVRSLELSAFISILRECKVDEPILKLRSWNNEAKEKAAIELQMNIDQIDFLNIDFNQALDYIPLEDSFFILFKSANDKSDPTTAGNIAALRLALIQIVGEKRQQELVGHWNEILNDW